MKRSTLAISILCMVALAAYCGLNTGPLVQSASNSDGSVSVSPTNGGVIISVNGTTQSGVTSSNLTLVGGLTNDTVRTLTQGWYATAGTPVTNGAQAYDVTIVFKQLSGSGTGIFAQVLQTNGFDGTIETNLFGEGGLTALTLNVTNTWKGVVYSNDVVNLVNVTGTTTVVYSTKKPH